MPKQNTAAGDIRYDRTKEDVESILTAPLFTLLDRARAVHRRHHSKDDVQLASLLSIKTGACPEDCRYCPQSARYKTGLQPEKLLDVDTVLTAATKAKHAGAGRFCMGAAWRRVRDGADFDRVLDMVRGVRDLGMEVCATLGMVSDDQARRLKEAGLSAYNHNLDTSPEFYSKVITSRRYQDRLDTLDRVRRAGISVCCGGIIGMGETTADRARLLQILAGMRPHPDSVPINALVAVDGTPMKDCPPVDPIDMVRMCATARILMPKARVRLSAGRRALGREAQVLCFFAGANSIFYGDKLLTTANPEQGEDMRLLQEMGLRPMEPSIQSPVASPMASKPITDDRASAAQPAPDSGQSGVSSPDIP